VAALADRMRWSRSRLSRQLGRMERRGLIARVPCQLDGRGDDVEITEVGRRALAAAEPVLAATVRGHLTAGLDAADRAALARIAAAVAGRG
jgi:DNA-binding MarR family transcriptional regulator